jgi:putative membrane protein
MFWLNSLMASVHHLAAFTLTACLVYEWLSFSATMPSAVARRIQRVDLWYGISAAVMLVAGVLRVIYFAKGADFYIVSPMFWVKMALFVIVGLLSIIPTVAFIRWRVPGDDQPLVLPADEARRIRRILNLELVGLALILVVAPAMARGIGLN